MFFTSSTPSGSTSTGQLHVYEVERLIEEFQERMANFRKKKIENRIAELIAKERKFLWFKLKPYTRETALEEMNESRDPYLGSWIYWVERTTQREQRVNELSKLVRAVIETNSTKFINVTAEDVEALYFNS